MCYADSYGSLGNGWVIRVERYNGAANAKNGETEVLALASTAYFLIVTAPHGGITTIPYADQSGCKRAEATITAERLRRISELRRSATPNTVALIPEPYLDAICVPT